MGKMFLLIYCVCMSWKSEKGRVEKKSCNSLRWFRGTEDTSCLQRLKQAHLASYHHFTSNFHTTSANVLISLSLSFTICKTKTVTEATTDACAHTSTYTHTHTHHLEGSSRISYVAVAIPTLWNSRGCRKKRSRHHLVIFELPIDTWFLSFSCSSCDFSQSIFRPVLLLHRPLFLLPTPIGQSQVTSLVFCQDINRLFLRMKINLH